MTSLRRTMPWREGVGIFLRGHSGLHPALCTFAWPLPSDAAQGEEDRAPTTVGATVWRSQVKPWPGHQRNEADQQHGSRPLISKALRIGRPTLANWTYSVDKCIIDSSGRAFVDDTGTLLRHGSDDYLNDSPVPPGGQLTSKPT